MAKIFRKNVGSEEIHAPSKNATEYQYLRSGKKMMNLRTIKKGENFVRYQVSVVICGVVRE